jgi:plasmid stabilization system protein ParE
MTNIDFSPRAEFQLAKALEYYFGVSEKVGQAFQTRLRQVLEFISRFPEASARLDRRHRYRSVRKHSYGVVYRMVVNRIVVVAIPHHSPMPRNWSKY